MRRTTIKKHSVEDLKNRFNLEHSDDLFGISQEIPLQCPRINIFTDDINDLRKHIDKLEELVNDTENFQRNKYLIEREFAIISKYMSTTKDSFEELRSAFENLRSWGQGWKILARNLFTKVPNNKSFLEEKYKKQI